MTGAIWVGLLETGLVGVAETLHAARATTRAAVVNVILTGLSIPFKVSTRVI